MKMARPRGTDRARVISVIETQSLRGTEEDPCRTVTQYWDFDGKKLAENDPRNEEKESKKRTVEIQVNTKEIRETRQEAEQLTELLREAKNQAAPFSRC